MKKWGSRAALWIIYDVAYDAEVLLFSLYQVIA